MGAKPRRASSRHLEHALLERIRMALGPRSDVVEKRMFGGVCFMVAGHMTVGTNGGDLMARVGADDYESALALPHARIMDFTGRPLRGFLWVGPAGVAGQRDVDRWVRRCLRFTQTLPAKG